MRRKICPHVQLFTYLCVLYKNIVMKKFFCIVIVCLAVAAMPAYGQMSEDKIIQYISEQQALGTPQEDIVMELSKRGVTIEQLKRIRAKYEKNKSTGIMGNTISDGTTENLSRTRLKQKLSEDPEYMSRRTMNQKESADKKQLDKNVTKEDRMLEMYDESAFLFPDSLLLMMEADKGKKEIFGHKLFKSDEQVFEASINVATPRDYVLGPGDEIIVDIWGASQTSVQEVISPDGNIIVDNIGPVYLNGLTIQEADNHVKRIFSQIYSGLADGDSDCSIQLSLGQTRSILVNVMGEVEKPGAYQMSAFATVFNALYMAGGVSDIGTLRSINVLRGGRIAATVDLYEYLMKGFTDKNIRLEDNDVVVVAPISCLVNIDGRVRRPMLYEMNPEESLSDLLLFAGGMISDAYRKDIRVVRMGEIQREIFTVSADRQPSFRMMDGDSVYVDSIMTTYSNMAEVRGAVNRPGMFEVGNGINTVRDLVEAAGGFREDAFLSRVLLNRTNPDKTLVNKALEMNRYSEGIFEDVPVKNNDVLFIPSVLDMKQEPTISIFGEVQFPGVYAYADNTHIEDMIIQAGGLNDAASISRIDVMRRARDRSTLESQDNISRTFSFSISENLEISDETFTLEPFDEVYVRRSPGYADNRRVLVEGEVLFPGYYSLSTKGERLSEIIERVGLFTDEAYPMGSRLERTMTDDERARLKDMTKLLSKNDSLTIDDLDLATTYSIGIDLQAAIDEPGGENDIMLRDGDKLIVPRFTNTVKMNGQVMYSNTIPYVDGRKLKYYINKAGGFSDEARRSRAYVVYQNGTVAKAKKHSAKLIQPGCEIVIPSKSERERMSTSEILSLSSTSASLATVVIALLNLFK